MMKLMKPADWEDRIVEEYKVKMHHRYTILMIASHARDYHLTSATASCSPWPVNGPTMVAFSFLLVLHHHRMDTLKGERNSY